MAPNDPRVTQGMDMCLVDSITLVRSDGCTLPIKDLPTSATPPSIFNETVGPMKRVARKARGRGTTWTCPLTRCVVVGCGAEWLCVVQCGVVWCGCVAYMVLCLHAAAVVMAHPFVLRVRLCPLPLPPAPGVVAAVASQWTRVRGVPDQPRLYDRR